MLASTERRSMIGFWKTIAWPFLCPLARASAPAAQRTVPRLGVSRPWQRRKVSDLPAPFGPSSTVSPPAGMTKLLGATSSLPSPKKAAASTVSGRIEVTLSMVAQPA